MRPVVAVNVMHVLLFVLHVCVLCEGGGNAGVGSGGGMSGTRGSDVLSSTGDVLEISVVRDVVGVCDMCMCLARGIVVGEGGEWMR